MAQWNIPDSYEAMVLAGWCQYSILGVETQNNMDSMNRFVGVVPGLSEKIEVDDGTQIVVTHPDPAKVIVIDASGLGDFYDSGFEVMIDERATTGLPVPEWLMASIAKKRLDDAAPDLLKALQGLLAHLGPRGYIAGCGEPATNRARAAVAKATGVAP